MNFERLVNLVSENLDDDNKTIQRFAEHPRMHETNTLRNAEKDQRRKEFEKWWDTEEVKNYKFPSDAARDACKNCALIAWEKSFQRYVIDDMRY